MMPAINGLRLVWAVLLVGLVGLALPANVALARAQVPPPAPAPEQVDPPLRQPVVPPYTPPPETEIPPARQSAPKGVIPPTPDEWVNDKAGVLSDPIERSLNRRLAAYEAQTGHQILVWIDRSTAQLPIETFAIEAFEQWKLGRAGLDDGVGIFVMVEDRAVRVEVGYGLEPVITDLAASQVIRSTMIPAIERGAWDAAIVGGVEALVDTIEGRAAALPPDPGGAAVVERPLTPREQVIRAVGIVIAVIFFIFLLIKYPRLAFLLLFFVGRGGGRNGGGGGFGGGGGSAGGGGATGRW